jgi:hypothetical protein
VIRAGIRSGFGDDWLRVIGVEWHHRGQPAPIPRPG